MKHFFQGLLIAIATLLCALLFLILTHTGNVWLWDLARSQLPQLQGELVKGSLPNGLVFQTPGWVDEDRSFTANWLTLQWQPKDLFGGELTINQLAIENLYIRPSDTSKTSEPDDQTSIKLPELSVPIPITVKQLSVDNGRYEQGAFQGDINQVQLSARMQSSLITINTFSAVHSQARAQLSGQIELKNDYPLNLMVDIQPEPDKRTFETDEIQLSLKGSLEDYSLQATTVITYPNLPATDVSLNANGSLQEITLSRLLLSMPGGSAELDGKLSWTQGVHWQGNIVLNNLNTGNLLPDFPGRLDGRMESNFRMEGALWHLTVPVMDIKGKLRSQPVNLSGTLDVDSLLKWKISRLNAAYGDNTLTAHGELDQNWNIDAQLNAPDLSDFYPGLAGEVSGAMELRGNVSSPLIRYQFNSNTLSYNALRLKGLQAKGNLEKKGQLLGQLKVSIDTLVQDSHTLNNLLLEATGNEEKHKARLTASGKEINGVIAIDGSYDKGQWSGQLLRTELNTQFGDWALKNPVTVTLSSQDVEFSELCLLSSPSSICLQGSELSTKQSKPEGTLNFSVNQLRVAKVSSLFPGNFDWQAELSAKGQVTWQNNQPTLNLTMNSTPGTIKAFDLSGDYEKLSLDATIANDQLKSSLTFLSNQLGHTSLSLNVDELQNSKKLSGQINIDQLLLELFSPFLPEVSAMNGTFSAKGRLDGTLNKPLFYGRLSLENGFVDTTREIISLSAINTYLEVNGSSGTVEGTMKAGTGSLTLGGNINWQDTLPLSGIITLKGDNLDVQYPGIGKIRVSPDLKLNLSEQIELSGIIRIPWGRIDINSLPESATSLSDDVIVVQAGQTSELQTQTSKRFKMKVRLALGDDISLDAYGLQTRLTGQLDLLQLPDKALEGHGTIELQEGRYRQLGQDLLIKEGKIIFQGPLDSPYLLVNAIRNPDTIEDNVVVGINVSGSISRPQWTVYSNPEMPQQEQLSYLLRGKGLEGSDSSGAQAMLLGLGVSQFGGVATSIGETLGFSEVSLDTEGSGDDTQITIGGYIAPGLRLQYGAGVFNSVGEVKVRYELMPRLYLQVVSGLAQAVDIFYRFTIQHE